MKKMEIVKVTRKGQVTLPQEIRKKLGVSEGDYLAVGSERNYILMRRVEIPSWKEIFAEGRRLAHAKAISEDDVLRAFAEVRHG
jgi:AbrB family looped-hinge helix DNA binding protein